MDEILKAILVNYPSTVVVLLYFLPFYIPLYIFGPIVHQDPTVTNVNKEISKTS